MNKIYILLLVTFSLSSAFLHGDHYDGALGHGLVYENDHEPHLPITTNQHSSSPELSKKYYGNSLLSISEYGHGHKKVIEHPIPQPEVHHVHPTSHSEIHHHLQPINMHKPDLEPHPEVYSLMSNGHAEPYPLHHVSKPRFNPSHLAVHGYEDFHSTMIPAPEAPHDHHEVYHKPFPHPEPIPESHQLSTLTHHPLPVAEHYHKYHDLTDHVDHFNSFYKHRKPGDGFGPGGHYDLMPKQEVKYFPMPEPVPVYKPVPVDKPYLVPVDKPYHVPVDHPVPEPYISKVIQPVIHKQAIIKSHVTHLTHEFSHPHSSPYHKKV